MFPLRCALVRAHTSKIVRHMNNFFFSYTYLDFLSAHLKNFPAHDEKKLEGILLPK